MLEELSLFIRMQEPAFRQATAASSPTQEGFRAREGGGWRPAFDISSDGMLVLETADGIAAGRFRDANPAICRMLGYLADEIRSLAPTDMIQYGTDGRATLRARDGHLVQVSIHSRHFEEDGRPMVLLAIRDVSDWRGEQEAQRRFELLAEHSRDVILFVRRADGRILDANAPALRTYGYSREEILDLSVRDLRAPAFRDQIEAQMKRADTSTVLFETTHVRKDGSEFPVEVSSLGADVGGERLLISVVRDITERKLLLSQARARQELLTDVVARLLASEDPQSLVDELAHKVMETLNCRAFFNFVVDERRGCLRLNACAGIPPEAAREIEWLEYGTAVCGCVARDGCRIVAEDIQNTPDARTDLVKSFGIQAYACHPLLAGGKVIGTLSFGAANRPAFSDDDLSLMQAVTHHIAVAMERVEAQKRLRESEERYRAIARSIPDGGVLVFDDQLRCLVVEGDLAGRLGMSRETVEGRHLRQIIDEGARDLVEQRFRAALSGQAGSYETEYRGRKLWSQYVPLRGDGGRVTAAMALVLDVTERKRIENRLLEAQKMESVAMLAGGIAHDFNNLLVGIIGNASLAADLLAPGHPAGSLLQDVLEAGERAAHLTREMLAYSGKGRFVIEPVVLSDLVREVVALVRSSVPNPVTLRLDLQPDLPPIQADLAQIQQVVMNLVINAAEAIGDRTGLITVRTRVLGAAGQPLGREWESSEPREGPQVLLDVRDTGCGMDEATRARIFDPFFTTKFTGRGLGLAAVSGIVRGHKGALRVESAPGKGSSFAILFPASVAISAPAAKATREPRYPRGHGRVLLVDDESSVRQMAAHALEHMGYTVVPSESGAAAVEALTADSGGFDLVVLDLSMPGMSGQETLARLRRIKPDLPVVMSSGYSEAECLKLLADQPISGFLPKPYTAAALGRTVKTAIPQGSRRTP